MPKEAKQTVPAMRHEPLVTLSIALKELLHLLFYTFCTGYAHFYGLWLQDCRH